MTSDQGKRLFLVPVPLDFGMAPHPLSETLPRATLDCAANLDVWVCENAKSLRAFLKRVNDVAPLRVPLQQMDIHELPPHLRKARRETTEQGIRSTVAWLATLGGGRDMGLASEAGMPAIADAGTEVVAAAQSLEFDVRPMAGPVSLMLALAASGLGGQNFAFAGYAPARAEERHIFLRNLDRHAHRTGQTQILIETPYRNAALMESLLAVLAPATRLCIASGLTTSDAKVTTKTIAQWRSVKGAHSQNTGEDALTRPCVFVFGS